jgi:hypothetical protein
MKVEKTGNKMYAASNSDTSLYKDAANSRLSET